VRLSVIDAGVMAPIPEPQTYALLLAGLGLLGFAARRRTRAKRRDRRQHH
jgi:hypothetical protein